MSEPVATIKRNVSGQIYMADAEGQPFDMSKHVGSSLYTADAIAELSVYADRLADEKQAAIDHLVTALKGVIRVADRATDEFMVAHTAITKYDTVKDII